MSSVLNTKASVPLGHMVTLVVVSLVFPGHFNSPPSHTSRLGEDLIQISTFAVSHSLLLPDLSATSTHHWALEGANPI